MQVKLQPPLPAREDGRPWCETEEDTAAWVEFLEVNKV